MSGCGINCRPCSSVMMPKTNSCGNGHPCNSTLPPRPTAHCDECGIPGAKVLSKTKAPPSVKFFIWLTFFVVHGRLIVYSVTTCRTMAIVPCALKLLNSSVTCCSSALIIEKFGSDCSGQPASLSLLRRPRWIS
jgi:hypothetical protein